MYSLSRYEWVCLFPGQQVCLLPWKLWIMCKRGVSTILIFYCVFSHFVQLLFFLSFVLATLWRHNGDMNCEFYGEPFPFLFSIIFWLVEGVCNCIFTFFETAIVFFYLFRSTLKIKELHSILWPFVTSPFLKRYDVIIRWTFVTSLPCELSYFTVVVYLCSNLLFPAT